MGPPRGLDRGRVNVTAAAYDYVLLAAGDPQIPRLVDLSEIAGHEPPRGIERGLGCRLVVEIAEHKAGAATADLTDFARCGFDVGIVLPPDAKLVPIAGAPASLDDPFRRVIGPGVLVGAGLGHAVAALRRHTVAHQVGDQRSGCGRAGNAKAAPFSPRRSTGLPPGGKSCGQSPPPPANAVISAPSPRLCDSGLSV